MHTTNKKTPAPAMSEPGRAIGEGEGHLLSAPEVRAHLSGGHDSAGGVFDLSGEVRAWPATAPAACGLSEVLGIAAHSSRQIGPALRVFDVVKEVHSAKHSKTLCQVNSVLLLSSERSVPEHLAMPLSAPEIRRANFTAAVEAAGGVEPFCRRYEMNSDYVRQLLRGGETASGRNIGNRAARTIEAKLGLAPNALDHDGAQVAEPPADRRSPALRDHRLENDIDAIRYALGALITGLALTRPDEAAVVARALQRAPAKFLDRGLLPKLLEALGSGQTAAKGRPAARPPVKPRSS